MTGYGQKYLRDSHPLFIIQHFSFFKYILTKQFFNTNHASVCTRCLKSVAKTGFQKGNFHVTIKIVTKVNQLTQLLEGLTNIGDF